MVYSTAHPLGSIKNKITEQPRENSTDKLNAKINFAFAPGKQGDYSYPTAYYSPFSHQESDQLKIVNMDLNINATDVMVTTAGDQEANETMKKTFTVTAPEGLKNSEILLNGYDIQMKCADSECSEGDAVWPFKFMIDIAKNEEFTYTVTVIINRGQTENKEKLGKHMHFDVTIPVKVFFFNQGEAA